MNGRLIEKFNEWMKETYGFSWFEHEENLRKDGHNDTDIIDELISLVYIWSKETV